jgi:hypothetical protein
MNEFDLYETKENELQFTFDSIGNDDILEIMREDQIKRIEELISLFRKY